MGGVTALESKQTTCYFCPAIKSSSLADKSVNCCSKAHSIQWTEKDSRCQYARCPYLVSLVVDPLEDRGKAEKVA